MSVLCTKKLVACDFRKSLDAIYLEYLNAETVQQNINSSYKYVCTTVRVVLIEVKGNNHDLRLH